MWVVDLGSGMVMVTIILNYMFCFILLIPPFVPASFPFPPLFLEYLFGFWFLVCYVVTQVTIQLQQECIQVVCSNREARKRPAESNGTPAMDLGFEDIRKPAQRYRERGKEQNSRT